MKPLNLFAVLMCCCYVAVAQNIPSGRGALPVPIQVEMNVRHYCSMVDEGADGYRILAEWKGTVPFCNAQCADRYMEVAAREMRRMVREDFKTLAAGKMAAQLEELYDWNLKESKWLYDTVVWMCQGIAEDFDYQRLYKPFAGLNAFTRHRFVGYCEFALDSLLNRLIDSNMNSLVEVIKDSASMIVKVSLAIPKDSVEQCFERYLDRFMNANGISLPQLLDYYSRTLPEVFHEGADERKLQELLEWYKELKLRIYLARRLLRSVDR